MKIQDLVAEFHEAFGVAINDRTPASNALRIKLILEESAEVVEALEADDLLALAKELADLAYVLYGTAVTRGIDLDAAVRAVHESNMSKLVDGRPILREDGKVLKGPNYRAPDMSGCLPGWLEESA